MSDNLAIDGGRPVRETMLPYGRQCIDERDIAAVSEVLRSDWLTTGPMVAAFEKALADLAGVAHAVAVSNGTAALHAAMYCLGVGPGDEVLVPAMTFAATANCIAFLGGTPVFVDVDSETLLIDSERLESRITPKTKAIIAVDYAGQPCDYDLLRSIAQRHSLRLVDDASHAIGGTYKSRPVGSLAALSTFSFHPVKHVAMGEGGAIATDDAELSRRMRMFRHHGIDIDSRGREENGYWFYEMLELGFNYHVSDIQCALGISQLAKLSESVARRQAIAAKYDAALADMPAVTPLAVREQVSHAYHLYVVRLELEQLRVDRGKVFDALRAEGMGVNVHYIPVHLHPFYRKHFGTAPGDCPVAEAAYERIISLPMFPGMSDKDSDDVLRAVAKVTESYRR
ncbi:MAG: UDP-4-amino-4,6-dideoxy-N-acetyl-beta-L-altrosamine transaminase [Thermoguttaceae bacterium]